VGHLEFWDVLQIVTMETSVPVLPTRQPIATLAIFAAQINTFLREGLLDFS
jgi:hypothetical protein